MEPKWLAFDIETAQGPPTVHESGNWAIGVTCAVTQAEGQEPVRWMDRIQPDGRYALRMSADSIRRLAHFLVESAANGYKIVGINSLSFDLQVLAAECQDLVTFDNLRDLARNHYDPCFQMVCQRGFPVGLDAFAKGFGLQGKTEGMDGEKAAAIWSGSRDDQEAVLAYCEQDAKVTLDVALNIESASAMRWVSKRSGKRLWEKAESGLLTVRECLALPDDIDTSWMDDPEMWAREKFSGWTK